MPQTRSSKKLEEVEIRLEKLKEEVKAQEKTIEKLIEWSNEDKDGIYKLKKETYNLQKGTDFAIKKLDSQLKYNARRAAGKRANFGVEQKVQNARLSNVEGRIDKLEKIDNEIGKLKFDI